MSLVKRRISARLLAANQANAQKSTGPRTPEGKARAALNAIKEGAFVKNNSVMRLVIRQRGEEPADYQSLHEQLVATWHPDDTIQAIIVTTLADKTWERLGVRKDLLDSRLTAFQCDQIEGQRQALRARRWLAGELAEHGPGRPLWQEANSPKKFRQINAILNLFDRSCGADLSPEESSRVMNLTKVLYNDNPTDAGEKILQLFYALFHGSEAARKGARENLPIWIARERKDVARERQLYQRERTLRTRRPNLPEKELLAREAVLDRQIADQIRLLLELKSKRSLFQSRPEGVEAAPPAKGPTADEVAQPAAGKVEKGVA